APQSACKNHSRCLIWQAALHKQGHADTQGQTENSWGPRAIGDHGAPKSSPTLKPHPKKAY
ncbi:unnamed protein product, partial [Staurois parvus]